MYRIVIIALTISLVCPILFAQNSQQKGESLALDWPDEENWKLGSSQENQQMATIELVRNNETLENWTELGTMTSYKGVTKKNVEQIMQMFFDLTKKTCAEATLSILEKSVDADPQWIIFSIECGKYDDGTGPESQVWYVIQGKDALYSNQRALKVDKIPDETKQAFVEFFKKAKLVYSE